MNAKLPPRPASRADRVSLWRHMRLFRRDILSSQPERLYRAWMAEFRTPFFRSYLVNDPALVDLVLNRRPMDFPKSDRVGEGLRPLLGRSVFVTNGAEWQRQRRIIDPAFEGGRLRATYPAMLEAARAASARLAAGTLEIEAAMSHATADVIFRTLFSLPIEDALAARVFDAFRAHQRSQPILNLAALVPLPRWVPRPHRRRTRQTAREIRDAIEGLTRRRAEAIARGRAPADLATAIMTTPDPASGETFSTAEMIDQVAIFFLAGHETSASTLSWALYLLATHPDVQDEAAAEAAGFAADPSFGALAGLTRIRDVLRETLRLYPPVPMMVRQSARDETFRGRAVRAGAQVVLSPWHLHRHARLWRDPDAFDPGRWSDPVGREAIRKAYIPFSSGARACPGAGFAMAEGVLMLAVLLARWRFEPVAERVPVPVAHLTLRARDGIWLRIGPRPRSAPGPGA